MIKKTIATLLLSTTLAGGLAIYNSAMGESLKEQVSTAVSNIQQYESNETTLKGKLIGVVDDANSKILAANRVIQLRDDEISRYIDEIIQLSNKVERLQQELDESKAYNAELINELNETRTQMTNLQGQVDKLNNEKAELQDQIDTLNSEKENLQGKIEELEASNSTLVSKLEKVNADLEKANAVIKESSEKLEAVNTENEPMSSDEIDNINTNLYTINADIPAVVPRDAQ